ncbi:aldehyde ferredoxin oxidoreductase C-terminal domain-containing protein [Natranaerobius thermophilus]|uniref:Aldehyde ferredoxin oxidoreductase n=1 Tax=Natranaerobius thermophilus (strain ATCC BAA-1301 / DSM 18059 / JW/NM-WN-LF) TaxID=457570 RepID=B2A5Y7_NATTJ|nr:aldehyde ferredoxin oxidoreductase C-terminal domain-containing protein [Natranaerobius thermophilus]ACB85404.1 Aldehyde ferredoxin oxidoreductase [Natranaerobius thermophilus JW/NM-WN-LF]
MNQEVRANTRFGEIYYQEELGHEYLMFGNRGLVAKMMNEEVDPRSDPLGPDNKLFITTGIFAGTPVNTGHRLSFGGKSPLTGTIKESNVGGNAAYHLAGHGIKLLVIEDTPKDDNWRIIKILQDGQLEFADANEFVGLNTYEFTAKAQKEHGEEAAIISIGQAGERKYNLSAIMVTEDKTGYPCRAAARGGLAAVMATKKIKGIVIEKPDKRVSPNYYDREQFVEANKRFTRHLQCDDSWLTASLRDVGTIGNIDVTAATGILPVNNFRGDFFDKLNQLNSKAFLTKLEQNGGRNKIACQPGCAIRCSNEYRDEQGEIVTSSLEYETISMLGPNCDIADYDFLAEIDRKCDDFGIDTIEFGNTVAMCMEAGKIEWGDKDGVKALLEELEKGTEFGKLLGRGTKAVGEEFAVKRIPTVKGQAMSAYDPRNLKGIGVTYAVTPMGADHTCGVTMMPGLDHMNKAGQVQLSSKIQMVSAAADNCMCLFAFQSAILEGLLPDIFAGYFGGEWTTEEIIELGAKTIAMEKEFNTQAGFSEKDDLLPEFFYHERSQATGEVFDITAEELKKTFPF